MKKKKLKEWCEKHEINLNFVLWAQKLILKSNLDKQYLICPYDIIRLLIVSVKELLNCSNSKMDNLLNSTNSFIYFSLCEYSIYKKYNQLIITFACLLIGISSEYNDDEKQRDLIKNFFRQFDFINLRLIEECEKDILSLINDNNSDDDEEEFEYTRPSSLNSLFEELNNNEKLKEDKNSLNN